MSALIELDEAIGWVFELAEERDEGAEAVWDRDGFLPYSIRRQKPYRKETNDERPVHADD